MAKLTRKEFAALCHTNVLIVNSNKARGKIVVNEEGYINTNNALNKAFFERYNEKFQQEKNQTTETQEPAQEEPKLKKNKSKKKSRKDEAVDEVSTQIVDYAARKKKADALLQEYKAEHEKLKMNKMAGKLIPVDLVFRILNIHNKSIFSTFQSDAENLASVYCEILAEGDRKKLAEIMGKLATIIDESVNKSRDMAEVELENAIAEYSETLNRGQRK